MAGAMCANTSASSVTGHSVATALSYGENGGSALNSILGNGGTGGDTATSTAGNTAARQVLHRVLTHTRATAAPERAWDLHPARAAQRLPAANASSTAGEAIADAWAVGGNPGTIILGAVSGAGGSATATATSNGTTLQQILLPGGTAIATVDAVPGSGTTLTVGTADVNVGTVTVTGFGGMMDGITGIGTLTVGNGVAHTKLQMTFNSGGSTQSALTVMNGSTLDLVNNHFIVSYGNNDPAATIRGYLISGYNSGGRGTEPESTAHPRRRITITHWGMPIRLTLVIRPAFPPSRSRSNTRCTATRILMARSTAST